MKRRTGPLLYHSFPFVGVRERLLGTQLHGLHLFPLEY